MWRNGTNSGRLPLQQLDKWLCNAIQINPSTATCLELKRKIKQTNHLIPGTFARDFRQTPTPMTGEISHIEWFHITLSTAFFKSSILHGENCHLTDFLGVTTIYLLRICLKLRICLRYLKADKFWTKTDRQLCRNTVIQGAYLEPKRQRKIPTAILTLWLLTLHYYHFFNYYWDFRNKLNEFRNSSGNILGFNLGVQLPQCHRRWELLEGRCVRLLGEGAAALQRGSTLLRSDRTYGNFSC